MASINDYGKSDIESLAQPKLGGTDGWAAAVAAALDGSDETVNQRISILRGQLETADAAKVAKAGDTMTGPLTLPGNPTNALHAATKGYVDQRVRYGSVRVQDSGFAQPHASCAYRILTNYGVIPLVLVANLVSPYNTDAYPPYEYFPDDMAPDSDTITMQMGFIGPNYFNLHINFQGKSGPTGNLGVNWIAILP
jgi:hypothetical protein